MHQGQLLKEPTPELNKLSLPTSIPRRDHSWQAATIVSPSTGFKENTKMWDVLRAYSGNWSLVLWGQLTACAKPQLCSRTTGGSMRHRMPGVQFIWS